MRHLARYSVTAWARSLYMVFATAFSTAVLTTGVTVFITAGASLLFAEETAETESRAVWKSVDTSDSTVTERDSLAPTSEVEDDLDEEIDTKKVDPALALPAAKTAGESQVSKPALFGKPVVGQPAGRRPAGQSVTTSSRPTASSAKANPPVGNAANPAAPAGAGKATPEAVPAAKPLPGGPSPLSGEKYTLKSVRQAGSTDLVETLLEVSGTVKQYDEELKQQDDKMEVVAGFRYEERIDRFSILEKGMLRSIRQYNLAKAKMKIGDSLKIPELDTGQRLIVCSYEKNRAVLFSPVGPLKGEQMLLIEDLPGNTLILDRLLPTREVKIGDSWKIAEPVLQAFLSVDAVGEANVEAVLTAVADNMAMVEVVGDLTGIYLGAETKMIVRAKYQFDLNLQRINWLGMMIEEDRSIGHVGPGLDLVARLQVKISPLQEPQSLVDEMVAEISKTPEMATLQLEYADAKGPWHFLHDRSWYVSQDDDQTTILRKLSRGELVAQCNIADMGKVDPKSIQPLGAFTKELVKGLGENFSEVMSSEESENGVGYKEYCVHIDGNVDDLPLRWIYYLLTDELGNQAVVVFVIEASQLEAFADSDRRIVDSFRIGR